MKVVNAWRSLNAEQKGILRDKRVTLDRPVDELLALLKPLAACDAMADKSRSRLGCTFAITIVLTIVLAFVLGMIAAAAMLVLAIAAGYFYFWSKRIDVSNNFRQFVIPVLTVFREDIGPARPVHLELDLSSPTAPSKKQGESAPYKSGVYHKVIDTTYVDPWMAAEAVLVDGTKLSWRVTDAIRERKKTKRNPRGKYKSKTKYTKKTNLEVTLGLRKKTYELAAPADADVTSSAKRNVVTREQVVRTESLDPIDPRALIDLIADVYRHARVAKKEVGA